MTYAQRFKAKVAEVMPECSELFNSFISRAEIDITEKFEIIDTIANCTGNPYYEGVANTICAVIDHEESKNG